MKKIRSSIRGQDMFGHPVVLNFNRQGDTFTTVLGGCLSIIINAFLLGFVVYKGILLVDYRNDSIGLTKELTDYASIGELNMARDSSYMPYWQFYDAKTFQPIPFTDDLFRYFRINIVQNIIENG